MAYQVPPRFSHGQYPTAADLNKLSDSDASLYARLAGDHHATTKQDGAVRLANVWRWLWYATETGTAGELSDPAGVNDPVSLSDTAGVMTLYDLANVTWLSPGRFYRLTDVQYAAEDKDP